MSEKKINNLKYAYDTLIITSSVEQMNQIMQKLATVSAQYSLQLNTDKTKVMIIDRANNNITNVYEIMGFKVVDNFNYLRSMLTNSGGSKTKIRRKIAIAQSATTNHTKLWRNTITKKHKAKTSRDTNLPHCNICRQNKDPKKSRHKPD